VKLLLDHHYSTRIAESLRAHGHDVLAAVERGWHMESDETLLALCAAEQRVLLTNNVADFMALHRHWLAADRQHAGIVFTSDQSLPRTRAGIGVVVDALERMLSTHPGADSLNDRVLWLAP
jgi:predicted nuclease of predicted toxin-antitoxin system